MSTETDTSAMTTRTFGQLPWTRRNLIKAGVAAMAVGATVSLPGISPAISVTASDSQIEPNAGTWKTWVLASGSEMRLPAPPDQAATAAEMQTLKTMAAQRDAAALDQIAFWDAGAPSYRWVEATLNQIAKKPLSNPRNARLLSLVNVAMYDAIIAAWDTKYAYNRPRPSDGDGSLTTALPNPASPSYPSEHAVVAGAASAVLAYLYPDDAQSFMDQAQAAAQSRLLAGVHFPSDAQAGLDLGRAVGARVVARAKADGSDAKWTGSVPTEPGHWTGMNPIEPLFGTWKPWVLTSGDQFRPGPPPAADSPKEATDLAEVKNFNRTLDSTQKALYWNSFQGGFTFWYDTMSRHLWEYHLADNTPRAARAYALMSIAFYDAFMTTFDAKYAYWAPRPIQLDPDVKPIFPTPNHPSYVSSDAATVGATAAVLGYLFPATKAADTAKAEESSFSRLWAGIHFRTDIEAALAMGRAVGQQAVLWAQADGSQ